MSKYNFEIDLETSNSISIIVDRIKDNSKVLEFGCAHGRLTKHLSENKSCKVTIVEIDEESGKEAAKYAETSFIGIDEGNIENYHWYEVLNERYDYIVFADVLEHLYNPSEVLKKASMLLKETGRVLVSIPNIGHESIIIDLMNDKFEYRQIGLLDNTHIRFFTKSSFESMVDNISGIGIENIYATYAEARDTELNNSYDDINYCMIPGIRQKPNANVYQYIFEIAYNSDIKQKTDYVKPRQDKKVLKVYFSNKDKMFSEDNTISVNYIESINNSVSFDNLENPIIRIDPADNAMICQLNKLKFYDAEDNVIDYYISSSNELCKYEGIYIFSSCDPNWTITLTKTDVSRMEIDIKVLEDIVDTVTLDYIKAAIISNDKYKSYHISNLEQIVKSEDEQLDKIKSNTKLKENHIFNIEQMIRDKDQHINNLEGDIILKDQHINNLEDNIRLKDQHINNLEDNIVLKDQHINNLEDNIVLKDQYINNLENELGLKENHINNINNIREQQEINFMREVEDLKDQNSKLNIQIYELTKQIQQYTHNKKKKFTLTK